MRPPSAVPRLLAATAAACAALSCLSATARAQNAAPQPQPAPSFQGPLPVRLREGLTGVVYLTEPESADVLPRGASALSFYADDGNTSYSLRYADSANGIAEQGETQAFRLTGRHGLGSGWDLAVTGALLARDGGAFGGFINWWHHTVLLGLHDSFREGNGAHADFIHLVQNGQDVIDLPDANATSGLIVLQARRQLVRRTGPTERHPFLAAIRAGIKIPLASASHSEYLDNGATDTFTGLEGTCGVSRRFWLHADVDVLLAGTTHVLALSGGRRVLPQTLVAAEYVLGSGTSGVVQVEDSSYPYRLHLPNRADQRRQTTFGLWRALAPRTRAFLSLSENVFGWQVTSHAPDVMFSSGVQRRF